MKINTYAMATAVAGLILSAGCTPPPIDPVNWYFDGDLDGYGDPGIVEISVAQPSGYVGNSGDCNDSDATINPDAAEVFDSIDNNCDGIVDNVPYWYADTDTDGYGDPSVSLQEPTQPEGYVADNTDCDDTDASAHPGAIEQAGDEVDNNCNGQVDELAIGNLGPAGGIVFYLDETGRGGLEAAPVDQTNGVPVEFGCLFDIPGADGTAIGTGAQNTEDILAAGCTPSVPGNDMAFSLATDYSLNGFDDWFLPSRDELAALYSARYTVGSFAPYIDPYNPIIYWSSSEIYPDTMWGISWTSSVVWPSGAQVSAGKLIQAHVRAIRAFHGAWYADSDGDGYGDPDAALYQFSEPLGYVLDNTDCDDSDAITYPGATEVINGVDNDCDGRIDEQYDIGDTGPAGGIVFWVDPIDDHGLEVSPVDLDNSGDFYFGWGCLGVDIPGADGTAIGSGAQNTADIIAAGCTSADGGPSAAAMADAYSLNGYNDWFLPSKDALDAMRAQKEVIGTDNSYWSSYEGPYPDGAYASFFWSPFPAGYYDKEMGASVRAVRLF